MYRKISGGICTKDYQWLSLGDGIHIFVMFTFFMSVDYFCKEGCKNRTKLSITTRKESKNITWLVEIYSLSLGKKFQCNSAVNTLQILAIGKG